MKRKLVRQDPVSIPAAPEILSWGAERDRLIINVRGEAVRKRRYRKKHITANDNNAEEFEYRLAA